MISFYPGPSQLYPQIRDFMLEAVDSGILSVNHRSDAYISMAGATIASMKRVLRIPDEYQVYFVSSATECWEIIAQSLILDKGSVHLYNGAFGRKWYEYTARLSKNCRFIAFDPEEEAPFPEGDLGEMVCVTHNETSNATQLSMEYARALRKRYPDTLIAVDATSSMAGCDLDFEQADIWFASAQKCFGLPAGLAVMVCSPRAIERAKAIGEEKHYNSLLFIDSMARKTQTAHTPNVLNIFLLGKIMEIVPEIHVTAERLRSRKRRINDFFENQTPFSSLIKNRAVQSDTVLCFNADKVQLKELKKKAASQGLLLGNGYGPWADNSFRIANFPAIQDQDYDKLTRFIKNFS